MNLSTSFIVVSSLHSGWSTPNASMMDENLCLSSALSMFSADVPKILTLLADKRRARLFGICPPTETIAPCGFSNS